MKNISDVFEAVYAVHDDMESTEKKQGEILFCIDRMARRRRAPHSHIIDFLFSASLSAPPHSHSSEIP